MHGPGLEGIPWSIELTYVLVLFVLFVVPRMLQRLRLPPAITSLVLGAVAGMGFGLFLHDPTIHLLSTFGIVALFLFAGLDVDVTELRQEGWVLAQHLVIGAIVLVGVTWLVHVLLRLDPRPATLVALALLTPSTGFILDSLPTFGMSEQEHFWVRSKTIATELLALVVLFVTLQSTTALQLTISVLVLVAMILLVPLVLRWFAARIVPHAPKSEFAFLLILAVLCAFVTRELGVYYLVGAFVVGMAAQQFRHQLPAIASDEMLHAVEVFASLFIPFYFFSAGLELDRSEFQPLALLAGTGFLIAMIPLRTAVVVAHRRLALREPAAKGIRISLSMLPTLVFTLVLAQILRDRFEVPAAIFGGLVIYAVGITLIPGFMLFRRSEQAAAAPASSAKPAAPPE